MMVACDGRNAERVDGEHSSTGPAVL
jgi:hypothetical protein